MKIFKELSVAIKFVINENWTNKDVIIPLAITSIVKTNLESTLGPWWTMIRDILYYVAFYFMTFIMSGGAAEMDGMPKIVFIATGMVPFFVFTDVMASGMSSIIKNKVIFTKMKFPITVIPVFECFAIFLNRMQSIALIFALTFLAQGLQYFNPLAFVYYTFCLLALSISFIFFLSALGTISKDFREIIFSLLRIFMFFVPIMWPVSILANNQLLNIIAKLNPVIYVMEGYRSAFSTGIGNTIEYTIYFWICITVFFVFGSFLQYKLRRIYADII